MDTFAGNMAALAARSPAAARRVADLGQAQQGYSVGAAADGLPIVLQGSLPLESRRDPRGSARRLASQVGDGRLVVAGFGAGYLVEALLDAGRDVAAIVESGAARLAAAMRSRDLLGLLGRVPVILLADLADPVDVVCLKAEGSVLAVHGASVSSDPGLQELVQAWPRVPVPRRPPRVMVVGPIHGGSLETARSTARAMQEVGAETRFLDFAAFATGWEALSKLQIARASRSALHARYSDVLGEAVLQEAAAWRPDLVLALAQAPLGARVLEQMRAAGIRTAFWFVENFRVLPYWKQVAAAYDVFFAIQKEPFLSELAAAGAPRAFYLPTACDRSRHIPVLLTPDERTRYGADVSFAGAPYLNRRRLLLALSDFKLRLWGEGWNATELAPWAADAGKRFSLSEMVRVFAGTRVNLNIHSAAHVDTLDPDPDYVNPRTFELSACGAFQLVDDREPLRDLFAADEVVSFRTMNELRDQVAHFLSREDERAAMAARARRRALADHTFENRARTILRETLPIPLVAGARLGLTRETLDAAIRRAGQSAVMSSDEAALRILKELEAVR
jgi:spore maturation protein CgeB